MSTLAPGSRVGPYEIVGALGAGGMGEVFRARDLTLRRDVALKVLLPAFAEDAARRTRLAREARLLATLNHPNVAQVYGVEDSPAGLAIVMEYVEGRTLRDLIRSGSVDQQRVPDLARQIASALDAAHEKGLIHRDLKPANIIVTPDGTAKLLDFGLAKAWMGDTGAGASDEATVTSTAIGALVGTPAYMSPEQARGQTLDRRADVWAFGCVLFELLSGRPAFAGDTISDTVAAVLEREPAWDAMPADASPRLRALAARCLDKDRRSRLRDIGDALHELSSPGEASVPAAIRSNGRRTVALVTLALIAGALATWFVMSDRSAPATTQPPAFVRFELSPPPGTTFGGVLNNLEAMTMEFSPDGTRLAFIARRSGEPPRIWIRALAIEGATEVPGTEGAVSVFWNPDSRSLGFFAGGQLRRIDLAGGAAVKICDVDANVGLTGTWGAGGDILFASVQGEAIYRVPAAGGTPTVLINVDPGSDQGRVVWPRYLPDGRRFLYTVTATGNQGQIRLADFNGTSRPLLDAVSQAQWVAPHWLLFVREGTLLGQRVDAASARVVGDPVSVAGQVGYSAATGWAAFTASPTGMIAAQMRRDESRLAWFDRGGRELTSVGAPGAYFTLSLSPNDQSILFTRLRPELGTYDLWVTDLARLTEAPVTSSPGMETGEVWMPNGRAVLYSAAQGTAPNLHHKDLTTGVERRLLTSKRFQFPTAVRADGSQVFYQQRTDRGTWDVMSTLLADPERTTPVFASAFSELTLRLSPAERHVAFISDESGRPQVYVAPFPVTGAKVMVSSTGGERPRWRRDGNELYFLSTGRLMAVSIDASGRPGAARALFDARNWLDFDVAKDGRFIANVAQVVSREQPLSIIVHWPEPAVRR
jgi:Tol biopolymer transport system component/predicted Ser/Thr protein kinase